MAENFEERAISDMTAAFIQDAGGSGELVELCRRLLEAQSAGSVCLPVNEDEKKILAASNIVSVLPDDARLLILDGEKNLFYTRRNWKYEASVRERVIRMSAEISDCPLTIPQDEEFASLKACQRRAIEIIGRHRFSILTGGPGTGKTYTIAQAVKLIRRECPQLERIALAAPTGKAAARVRETMQGNDAIEAVTLHTLLKPHYDFVTFQNNAAHPLALDWLIVDEASMIDLPLMAKLLAALGTQCRLTLVGDADQLSSVEPGRVFGDLCAMAELKECVAELTESTRFQDAPEIFQLSDAIRHGCAKELAELFASGENVACFPLALSALFTEKLRLYWSNFSAAKSPEEALNALNECRVLCALRKGAYGTEKLNAFIRKLFPASPIPVMITRNDAALGVSNGDVGVQMPGDPERLFLLRSGKVVSVPTALLPEREMAFAATIHKSQGSEYDNVLIVLPPVAENSGGAAGLLTRELLYTAVTRARKRVLLFAENATLSLCCQQKTQRHTGLR